MLPYINIAGRVIPMYSVMMLVGMACVCLWLKLTERKRAGAIHPADIELMLAYSCIGAMAGAKLLYIATVWDMFRAELGYLFTDTGLFLQKYLYSGFVFYGGAAGAAAACLIYCRLSHIKAADMLRWALPGVPLVHAFGRVGCFMAGCCYGIESARFGIVLENSSIAPADVPLLPVQLLEAAAELMIFIITAAMALKGRSGWEETALWVVTYGCVRFALEFLRGDTYRGVVGLLSVSQIIAAASVICTVLVAAAVWIKRRARRQASPPRP